MKKLALITFAALVVSTGAASTAFASLSDRDAPVWRVSSDIQVAGRGNDHDGRNDGSRSDGARGRDAHRDRKDDDVIWRLRDGRHRPFFLFRHDRGPDCFLQQKRVRDAAGNIIVKTVHVCQ